MDIITKENDTQKIFLSENIILVNEILADHYPYILKSIKEENFILKYDECNLFKELVFDKKVVGFCSYDFSRQFMTASLNNIYVLPEFRGNGIFLRELEKTMEEHIKPSIMEPTRLVVEMLIKYGFACRVSDSIVASAIEFVIPESHVLSNADFINEELSTHFYDLDKCRCVHILDLNSSHVAYSSLLNYDIIHYDCEADLDGQYFKSLCEFFRQNDVELMNVMLDLENSLPIKNYTLEEVIGPDEEFSHYIETLIDDSHVTLERAFEIKTQIREEYEAGMILNESLLIRLAYLFDDDKTVRLKSHDDTCPYCGMPTDSHDRYCHFCGINLNYNPDIIESDLISSLDFGESDFREDIRYISYKFLKLVDEEIDVEYSFLNISNTYNISPEILNGFLQSNGYFKDGEITDKGYGFLNSHPLHFFEKYQMDIVNYTDFEKYFYAHFDENPLEVCIDYLKQFADDEYILEIIGDIENDY